MRRFVAIDLHPEPAPDESTILRYWHLLGKHDFHQETVRAGQRETGPDRWSASGSSTPVA
jgi:IS5 family transposase